jgi:hypothetical protein
MYDDLFDTLVALLEPLGRVRQDPRHHPEGDALYHSLQVFDLAWSAGAPPHLVAAALLHDVGKALAEGPHEVTGAALLAPIVDERTAWLIERHMDLARDPVGTRRHLRGDPLLADLERLRAFDLGGRRRGVHVTSCERAVGALLEPGVAEQWLHPTCVAHDVEG